MNLTTNSTSAMKWKCETDRECPEDMFCHEEITCVACFECVKLNRESRMRCAKSETDCGDCLPQFINDTFVKSNSQWCVNAVAERHKINDPNDPFNNVHWFGLAAVFILCVLGFALYFCYTKKRHTITINDIERQRENFAFRFSPPLQPPPYKEDPETGDDSSISCSFHISEQVEERTKAIPWFSDDTRNDDSGDAATPSNTNNTEAVSNFNIHEETTVPSSWTPGASYGQSTSTNEISQNERNETISKKRKRMDHEDDFGAAKKKGSH